MGQRCQSIYTHPCYARVIPYQTHGLTNLPNALVPLFIWKVGEEIRVIATQPTFHIRLLETRRSLQVFLGGGILHIYDAGRLGGRHGVKLQLSRFNQISSHKESQWVPAFILGFHWRPDSQDAYPASIFSKSAGCHHLRGNRGLIVSLQPDAEKPIWSGIRGNWQKSVYCLYNHPPQSLHHPRNSQKVTTARNFVLFITVLPCIL